MEKSDLERQREAAEDGHSGQETAGAGSARPETLPFQVRLGLLMAAHEVYLDLHLRMLAIGQDEATGNYEKVAALQPLTVETAVASYNLRTSVEFAELAATTDADKALLERTRIALYQEAEQALQQSAPAPKN